MVFEVQVKVAIIFLSSTLSSVFQISYKILFSNSVKLVNIFPSKEVKSQILATSTEPKMTSGLCPEDPALPSPPPFSLTSLNSVGNPLPQCFVLFWTLCASPDNVALPSVSLLFDLKSCCVECGVRC